MALLIIVQLKMPLRAAPICVPYNGETLRVRKIDVRRRTFNKAKLMKATFNPGHLNFRPFAPVHLRIHELNFNGMPEEGKLECGLAH
jgi:hypothetical protein